MVGRRLTLAPSIRRALQPKSPPSEFYPEDNEEGGDVTEQKCKAARESLSQDVNIVVALTEKPKPVHGVELGRSKFWANSGYDSDSSVD